MDIVERLRKASKLFHPVEHEAADEIERLRAELKKADDDLNDFAECIAVNKGLERRVAELQKDAARYQEIRRQNITRINSEREHWEQICTPELFDEMTDEEIEALAKEDV